MERQQCGDTVSNHYGVEPMETVKRTKKTGIDELNMPFAISKYNAGMLWVDVSDWKTQKYCTGIKGKKWYFCLVTHCLDVSVVNSHEFYKLVSSDAKKLDLLEFRCHITSCLLKEEGSNLPSNSASRIASVSVDARRTGKHFLERTEGNFSQTHCHKTY